MKRIVYSSAARANLGEDELKTILERARVRNARRDLTGMLLFRDGVFIQLLEGSEVEVDLVFESIRRDPRHHRVTTLVDEPITQRAFESWAMAFKVPQRSQLDATGGLPRKRTSMIDLSTNAPHALSLLMRFAEPADLAPVAVTQSLRRAALTRR
jgi:hypothetical protein